MKIIESILPPIDDITSHVVARRPFSGVDLYETFILVTLAFGGLISALLIGALSWLSIKGLIFLI
jgi:hypothetical protein